MIALILLFGAIGVLYLLFLDHKVKAGFEGKRHAVPAQVYGRSLELYGGADVSPDRLEYEFKRLGYRKVHHPKLPAAWSRDRNHIIVRTRPFDFWDGREPGRYLNLHFQRGRLQSMEDERGKSLPLVRLETPKIGSIYPSHNEDRVPIPRSELPEPLLAILMTIEDRTFYAHYGVDLKAILRATWANIRAGSIVQGGSTLTQQLAKNLYLTRERSFWRKATEALMALIIERRYTKDEILTAYVNEIYLGQDGNRAIHGFGLASHFYFNRPLQELDLPKLALLVGMIRGPSLYNPRRNPQRALERRNKVLDILYRQEVINETQKDLASRTPLGITQRVSKSGGGHPAFIDLVRRQLQRDYRPEDLTSEGLRVFTTLDPWSQQQAESAFVRRLKTLEKKHRLPIGKLEGAAIIAGSETGEILAVVGGRKAGYAGFNRALDAHRPIGSLVKPVVYLAALMHPNRYTLVTRIDDKPIKIGGRDGSVWKPKNFDLKAHGKVPLHQALSKSYNLATVNLGMDLGLAQVMGLLESLGVSRPVKAIPALLLGAVSLSPLEVTQFYQAFAAGGFLSPLRSIREVQAADGTRLQRYPLTVTQAVPAGPVYLLGRNLQEVVRSGTGRGLSSFLGRELSIAGKTGTTNDMRDSWFAGFSGNKVAVVWVGRDDNKPAGLTGAQGALQVWGDMMRRLDPAPLGLPRPDSVETVWIDPTSGLRADPQCKEAREYPFIKGSAPSLQSSCTSSKEGSLRNLFRSFFE
ncbi:MAG: penicillin-binding protein 1B [Gammaproteobacteria bacterium]|nr:penicillin-binding protein 1B [Gammaproteobacteria bacterium]